MILSAINSLIQAGKQNKLASRIHPVNTEYQESPYIKSLYGEGRNLYQGRMAGANAAEQNLRTNEANVLSGAEANAGDAGTLLAYGAGIHGQTDNSLTNLGVAESQDKQQRLGIYSDVSRMMANEGEKVYEDKLRNYYDDLNYKRGLEGAAMQNKSNFWGGIDDTIKAGISAFTPGGFLAGTLGGGGGGNRVAPPNNSPAQTVPNSYQPVNFNNRPLYPR